MVFHSFIPFNVAQNTCTPIYALLIISSESKTWKKQVVSFKCLHVVGFLHVKMSSVRLTRLASMAGTSVNAE